MSRKISKHDQLRVKSGCSVVGKDGTLYRAGAVIPAEMFDIKYIETELLKYNYVEIIYAMLPNTNTDLTADPPGVDKRPTLPGTDQVVRNDAAPDVGGGEFLQTDSKPIEVKSEGGVEVSMTDASPAKADDKPEGHGQAISKWSIDPASLTSKTLDELNVMILERDEKIEPFETPEEAVAFLSQDFGKTR